MMSSADVPIRTADRTDVSKSSAYTARSIKDMTITELRAHPALQDMSGVGGEPSRGWRYFL